MKKKIIDDKVIPNFLLHPNAEKEKLEFFGKCLECDYMGKECRIADTRGYCLKWKQKREEDTK